MKFDLHNLPFLAGGIDWSGEMYPNNGTGFCPGLYFIKKPISWGKNGYAIDAGSYRPTTPAEGYAGSADTKKRLPNWQWIGEDGKYKNLVEFILDQPNPKEYVAPYCLDSQTDRYPKDDCCDPTGEGGM